MNNPSESLPLEVIERRILFVRGQKIILDADLAWLYGVPTKALNQAVRRNRGRFPEDFLFQLNDDEKSEVVTICDHLPRLKFSPNPPYAFTEYGVIMAASVLNSERAVQVSVYIVRVFVQLRRMLSQNREMAEKMSKVEKKLEKHELAIRSLAVTLREITEPSHSGKRRRMGF